jgi:hypothetical protein
MSGQKDFDQFTKDKFEEVLDDTGCFFNIVNYDWANEYIYENESENGRFSIRVYSSIDKRTDKAREKGSDAIRVTVIDNESDRPVMKEKRVNRIKTWPKNLQKRIDKVRNSKGDLTFCCECGSLMVVRKRKKDGGKFWGCTSYPECKNGKDFN